MALGYLPFAALFAAALIGCTATIVIAWRRKQK
jgi:hypothetical protein